MEQISLLAASGPPAYLSNTPGTACKRHGEESPEAWFASHSFSFAFQDLQDEMLQLWMEKRGAKAACPHTWPNGELLPLSPSQWIWAHWLFSRVVINIVVSCVSTGRFCLVSPLCLKWGKWGLERRGKLGLVAHTCNPSLQQAQSEDCWEFELDLVNIVSSGTAPHYSETLFQEPFPLFSHPRDNGGQRFISVVEHLCYIHKVWFPVSSKENRKAS